MSVRSDAWIDVIFDFPVNSQTVEIMNRNATGLPLEAMLVGLLSGGGLLVAPRIIVNVTELVVGVGRPGVLKLTALAAENVSIHYTGSIGSNFEVRHGLTNFIFEGCQVSPTATGLPRVGMFSAVIDGYTVIYKQVPSYRPVTQSLGKDVVVTAEAMANGNISDWKKLNGIVEDSLMLLSLADGTYIGSIYEDVYQNGHLVMTLLKAVKTMLYHKADYCIDIKNLQACDLKTFLETSFPKYRELKVDFGLDIVIEYYLQAKAAEIIEVMYLAAVVGLERLASFIQPYLSKRGKWKKWDSLLARILRRSTDITLRRKVKALLSHFGVPYSSKDLKFIVMRNSIVHTGQFPSKTNGSDAFDALIGFFDRILLRILGYQGKYYINRLNSFQREIVP